MPVCFIGLGANLGNRRENISAALRKLRRLKGTHIIKTSSFIETEPSGGPRGQRNFINACVRMETTLAPHRLLISLKKIERQLGRKKSVRNGPRTIDLDILFYEGATRNSKTLKIPHPRAFERLFVVKPLLELL